MSAGWLPALGSANSHGPLVAFVFCLAISPGIPILLGRGLECRWPRPSQEYLAFLFGDPLLALSAALGVWRCGGTPPGPARWLVSGTGGIVIAAGWLGFGLWQWRAELRGGLYLPAQALAPTKIWHQVVVYPLLGYPVTAAVAAGVLAPGGRRIPVTAAILACAAAWVAFNVYDRGHRKLGHPPYDWRRLRPFPRPWPTASESLRIAVRADARPECEVTQPAWRTNERDATG
ncbi:hypothetical protein I6A60_07260 [Frankia sp. AgB1.9]|uniref:hypothetical protein n=1 Tax=unclassified Frankia TaxID=2632575 RepID=UPI0019339A3F|nr:MULTISPECIES: hypothetical protein [unclassified Frankia]MBL7488381.1 hypothetical protein [Frankia sp. AgW1.1]MBL7547671.1 hypothetical protein [Frankia sp. AgB1.9]MBL7624084.1 hypothetical protein [Frankia sp. AgB1.8]